MKRRLSLTRFGVSPATETTIIAVFVGILAAVGAMFFKRLIHVMQNLFWRVPDMMPDTLMAVPWHMRLLVPVAGGLIVGPLIYFFAREARGHGVPEVIAAVVTNNGVIRPAVVVVKTLASAVSISSGGSVGREGPIVQIGAAIASSIGQVLGLRPVQMKTVVGCGVAAGIGATFNAPIAGTIFALELIVGDFGLTAFTPIIVSAVTATAIVRHFHGNIIEFVLPQFVMVSIWELFLYVLLGVFAGVAGFAFSRLLYAGEDLFKSLRAPEWIKPAMGGLVIGIIALLGMPHIMGVGYETIEALFEGRLALGMMLVLVVMKMAATSVTIGSGGSGGIFAPSLFMGAMLGGAFGTIVNMVIPEMTGATGAYALVGMAAVNSAATLAPFSAIIVLIELTNNYGIILPLMLTVVIASFISRKLSPLSIYTRKLERRGIHVHMGEDLNILRASGVKDILRHDESTIMVEASFRDLVSIVLKRHRNVVFVIDGKGRYLGTVTLQDIKHELHRGDDMSCGCAIRDFMDDSPAVLLDQGLDTVLTAFGDTGHDRLAVVDGDGVLVGSVIITDVIRQYNIEIANRNIAIELGAKIHGADQVNRIPLGAGTIVTEIPAPPGIVGKTIGEVGLRRNHGVSVFLVKRAKGDGDVDVVSPGQSFSFEEGDMLLVSGSEQDIERISNLAT